MTCLGPGPAASSKLHCEWGTRDRTAVAGAAWGNGPMKTLTLVLRAGRLAHQEEVFSEFKILCFRNS